jgi:hypothetical protein
MDSSAGSRARDGLTTRFEVLPLPRWRAVLSISCAGMALLSAGAMLEYATGSPATVGKGAGPYWSFFFGFNLVAFAGTGLLGAFPRLATRRVKWLWGVSLLGLYLAAFAVWYGGQSVSASDWFARTPTYLPGFIIAAIGLLLSRNTLESEPAPNPSRDPQSPTP